MRGNHECASINRIYGFYDECKRRFSIKVWKTFTDCFNCLPIAAIIDDKIFCCHGGLSPDLQNMEQIRSIMRPTDVPETGLLCDLLWADPDKDVDGWAENDRGVSFTFGSDVVNKFLNKHDLGNFRYSKSFFRILLTCALIIYLNLTFRFNLPSPSGSRRWLRVFRQAATGHLIFRPKLLW